jgi:hypothetical protein
MNRESSSPAAGGTPASSGRGSAGERRARERRREGRGRGDVLRAVRIRAAGGLVAVLWADTAQLAPKRFSPRIAYFLF